VIGGFAADLIGSVAATLALFVLAFEALGGFDDFMNGGR